MITGTWTWTYAHNSYGDDLMTMYDYNTATFNSDGTYVFDIDNHSHNGTYTVDSDAETITFDNDPEDVWDIIEVSKSVLEIKQRGTEWYEFHFEK